MLTSLVLMIFSFGKDVEEKVLGRNVNSYIERQYLNFLQPVIQPFSSSFSRETFVGFCYVGGISTLLVQRQGERDGGNKYIQL